MFGCDKCPATFLHRYSLTRHMVAHSDVRFECEICKSLFKYKTNLKRHERNTHHIIRNTRQYITAYNVTTAAGSSSARNWIDLTGNSDVEDDPNNVRLGQNSVATKATSLQSNNQGDLTCMTFNMNSLKSERIDQIVSYTCNLNSNVCLCGYCTTLDIKSENEQNNVHIEYKPTIRMTVDSTVGEGMVIKRNSSEVKLDKKYKKRNNSSNKLLTLADLDAHKIPEERYKMAKEYIIVQHKKIKSLEKTIKDLENCIGVMNDELIRYKTEFKNKLT